MAGGHASESEEERKMRKRSAAIEAIMRTPAYIVSVTKRPADLPSTPVPDVSLSKRSWERLVMTWRVGLRLCLHGIFVRHMEALMDVE